MKTYCEEIAAKVWSDLSRSNLVTAEKLGKVPEIRFTALGDKFLGMAYSDHIELNEKYLQTQDKEKLKMTLYSMNLPMLQSSAVPALWGMAPCGMPFVCISAVMAIRGEICPKQKIQKQMIFFSDLQQSLLWLGLCFFRYMPLYTCWVLPIRFWLGRAALAGSYFCFSCGLRAAKLLNRYKKQLFCKPY